MYKACDVRNPSLRVGMTPEQMWRDHVRLTMSVLSDAGVDSNQFGDRLSRKLSVVG